MSAPDPNDLILVATVTKTHGLKGEFKIRPETNDVSRLKELGELFLGREVSTVTRHRVELCRLTAIKGKPSAIFKLEDVDTIEDASSLCGLNVYGQMELAHDEFFLHDLLGLPVNLDSGPEVGLVHDVIEMPGQIMVSIRTPDGQNLLVPFVEELIWMDEDGDTLIVADLEGLIPDEAA